MPYDTTYLHKTHDNKIGNKVENGSLLNLGQRHVHFVPCPALGPRKRRTWDAKQA